ncbi:Enoyl CoA hydratase [Profundibacterium mesophilum KAUST100406-0324]|uniref:Enoyl-CoA hydratase domain-containing protein 3, mitochondrial n=1 Tax=Profundibacterium mesophilum KAUST100406-0324 TaxID=1037889 RepID=A0A921NT13_9RHOB|nr:Enoyl CoA hydratase [Profundibacterium mesophilum KAUST100406-0324]
MNGVNIGLFCSTPMVALTRAVPAKQAFEMLVGGEFITAPRAAEIGLINRAVPAKELAAQTHDYAAKIAAKFGIAVSIGKRAFHEQREMSTAQAYAHCGDVMTRNMLDAQTEAGIEAFLAKAPPQWDQ